jgi:two-component system chemotaxis sensor kinase CheA
MILDPNGIAAAASLNFDILEKAMDEEKARSGQEEREKTENMLIFAAGANERFAVNLLSVARIEKRTTGEIESIGSREFLKHDGSSLRLFRLEHFLPIQAPQTSGQNIFVIVPKASAHPCGIVTTKIEDTVRTALALEKHAVFGRGILGSAVINDKLTVVLDMPGLLEAFEPEFSN